MPMSPTLLRQSVPLNYTERIAMQLRAQLGVQRVTIADLVRATGLSRWNLERVISGRRITVAELVKVTEALEMEVLQVVAEAER